jgi:hypothetical protein
MSYNRNSLEQLIQIDPTTVSNPISGEVIRGVYNGLHWTKDSAGTIIYGTPLSGSANYIQNQQASAQSANMWISGSGTFGGNLKLSNAYYLTGKLVAGTDIALIGRNVSNQVIIDPDGYSTVFGGSITTPLTIQATTAKLTNLTDGYIPYHISDASGLGNSNIFYNGTNVGIGTATPSQKLDIVGNAMVSGNYVFTGATTHYIQNVSNSDIAFKLWNGVADVIPLTLAPSGAATFSGSVTIGGITQINNDLAVNTTNNAPVAWFNTTGTGNLLSLNKNGVQLAYVNNAGVIGATSFNGITGINDTLTSTSTTLALTANKGKELQDNKVGNDTDTYTASAKVTKMITLSQSEYNAIGTKDANTMYIII